MSLWLDIEIINFFLDDFCNLELYFIGLLLLFFRECSNYFTSWNPFGVWSFAKIYFYFDILTWSLFLNSGFSIQDAQHIQCRCLLSISSFHFDCCMICFAIFASCFIYYINLPIFWYHSHVLVDLTLQNSDKSLSNNRLSVDVCRINLNNIVMRPRLPWSFLRLITLTYLYLVWFTARLIQHFLEYISDCNTSLNLHRDNRSILAVIINNTQQESDRLYYKFSRDELV